MANGDYLPSCYICKHYQEECKPGDRCCDLHDFVMPFIGYYDIYCSNWEPPSREIREYPLPFYRELPKYLEHTSSLRSGVLWYHSRNTYGSESLGTFEKLQHLLVRAVVRTSPFYGWVFSFTTNNLEPEVNQRVNVVLDDLIYEFTLLEQERTFPKSYRIPIFPTEEIFEYGPIEERIFVCALQPSALREWLEPYYKVGKYLDEWRKSEVRRSDGLRVFCEMIDNSHYKMHIDPLQKYSRI